VSTLLTDEEGQFLLFRVRERPGWELPGGVIAYGEGLEEALRRRLREQTGYEIEIRSLLSARISNRHHLDVRYLARVVSGTLQVDAEAVAEARFVPYRELPAELRAELPPLR
jgi:ADP-ribose pyrophosphatase YjhB (NUDIX family)